MREKKSQPRSDTLAHVTGVTPILRVADYDASVE